LTPNTQWDYQSAEYDVYQMPLMMNSRTFFQTTLTQAALLGAAFFAGMPGRTFAASSGQPQYYELRAYSTKSEQQKLVSDYCQNAVVPAYNRMGIQVVRGQSIRVSEGFVHPVATARQGVDHRAAFAGLPPRNVACMAVNSLPIGIPAII
jgi:hypothetical protein